MHLCATWAIVYGSKNGHLKISSTVHREGYDEHFERRINVLVDVKSTTRIFECMFMHLCATWAIVYGSKNGHLKISSTVHREGYDEHFESYDYENCQNIEH
jgi:outer membrane protease